MKRFKTRKKFNFKKQIYIVLSIIIFLLIFILISLHNFETNHKSLVNFFLQNTNFQKDNNYNQFLFNLDYLIPTYTFKEEKRLIYHNEDPLIYLYNTHDKEAYKDKKTVYDACNLLADNLKKIGINSLVEEQKTSDFIDTGLDYYDISRKFLKQVMEKYNNIKYYIDIHRDSVDDIKVTINNKNYAKVLFVLGKDQANYQENKKIMEKMNSFLNNNYKGISKGILEKSGNKVNGVYNQDMSSNVLLIEIGGKENNIEEVNNTTEVLSLMLYSLLNDK